MNINEIRESLDILGQKLGEKSRAKAKIDPEQRAEQDAKTRAYWDAVYNSQPVTVEVPKLQIARNWYRILKREVMEGKTCKPNQKPRFDGHIQKLYMAVLACAIECEELGEQLGIDVHKGILVIGDIGIAKSSVFRHCASKPFFKARMVACNTIRTNASKKGFEALEVYEKGGWIFDDLGIEGVALSYGQKIHPVQDLLYTRYDLFMRDGTKTYFTTNKNEAELGEIYDARFLDRINDTCNVIYLSETRSLRG